MATREQALIELYRRNALNPQQRAAVEELGRRGVLQLPATDQPSESLQEQAGDIPTQQEIARQDAYRQVAEEVGPIQAALIGAGRGFYNVGRGLGLVDPETEGEREAYQSLKTHRPYTTGGGEIIGESAPFIAAGGVGGVGAKALLPRAGTIGSKLLAAGETLGGRVATGTALGATEGGIVASGRGENVEEGVLTGAAFGGVAELLVPVVSRMAKSIYQKVMGVPPTGRLIDEDGIPTPELQAALKAENLTFTDLTENAADIVRKQQPGAKPEQVARLAKFEQADVRATKGDVTQYHDDQGLEARLLQSTGDPLANEFRQYKLNQSRDIDSFLSEGLEKGREFGQLTEDTGTLIKDALVGRKRLLKTEKNALYREFARVTENKTDLPIFTDAMADALPDPREIKDLKITAPAAIESFDNLLMSYGIKEPSEDFLQKGIEPEVLNAENFERFRKSINALERSDQTGALKVATSPVKQALDRELDDMAEILEEDGFGREITDPIKQARERVKTLKKEFDPKASVGKLVERKGQGTEQVIEASKVYSNQVVSKAVPVENVRRIIGSLKKSGEEGKQAIAALQTTTALDIINSAFSTKSRKIDGIRLFNPIAYKNRLDAIGRPKLKAIFSNDRAMLNRLEHVDELSEYLVKSAEAEPKGSSSTILNTLNKLQITAITSKVPLMGPAFNDFVQNAVQGQQTRREVSQAVSSNPEIRKFAEMLNRSYPGIASSLGISGIAEYKEEEPAPY